MKTIRALIIWAILAPAIAMAGPEVGRPFGVDWDEMQQATWPDDIAAIFGTDSDFQLEYDASNAYLQLGDGTNDFLRVTDDGTTATFRFLGSIVLSPAGTATLAFGDEDTKIYELVDDEIYIAIAGANVGFISSSWIITGSTNARPALVNTAPTTTDPSVIMTRLDADSGLGWAGANTISLITGAVEAMRIDSSQNVGIGVTPDSSWKTTIDQGSGYTLALISSMNDDAVKVGMIGTLNYDSGTETEGWQGMTLYAQAAAHNLWIGGGDAGKNAATVIKFYTAANVTTRTGTEAMRIDSSQQLSTYGDRVYIVGNDGWNSSSDYAILEFGNTDGFEINAEYGGDMTIESYNTLRLLPSDGGSGNVVIGAATENGNLDLGLVLSNGTAASAAVTDGIQVYSVDSANNTASLGLYLEEAIEALGTFTAANKVRVQINGTWYWIQLDPV